MRYLCANQLKLRSVFNVFSGTINTVKRDFFSLYFKIICFLLIVPIFIPAQKNWQSFAAVRNWQILVNCSLVCVLWGFRRNIDQVVAGWRASSNLKIMIYSSSLLSLLACVLLHYYGFRINGIDFSIFDQMLWHTRHGRFMYSSVYGGNHFAVHPSWIMLPLVPLHALFDSPIFLVALHAVVIWSALFPLERLVRRFFDQDVFVYLMLIAYLTHARTGSLVNHGFHFEVFYLPIGLWLIEAWLTQKWKTFLAALFLFLSIKEDAGLYLAGLGAGSALCEKPRRLASLSLILLGLFCFVINIVAIQPLFRDAAHVVPTYLSFWGKYGATLPAIAVGMLKQPMLVLGDILSSGWLELWGSFLFLPLLSIRGSIACLPAVFLLGSSASPQMHAFHGYYAAAVLPWFFLAWLEGASRFKNHLKLILLALLVAPLIGGDYMRFPSPRMDVSQDLKNAISEIRNVRGPICAQTILIPHLPYDLSVYPFRPKCLDNNDVILLHPQLDTFPHTPSELEGYLERIPLEHKYVLPSGLWVVRSAQKNSSG